MCWSCTVERRKRHDGGTIGAFSEAQSKGSRTLHEVEYVPDVVTALLTIDVEKRWVQMLKQNKWGGG